MIQLQYTNPTTGHRPVLPIVKRDIPPGFSVSDKEYRPTMHPKCAAALADKDGKKKLMLKGRTEVTAGKREDLHKKRGRKNAVSYCFLSISIRNKTTCCAPPGSTNHQGQAVQYRISTSGRWRCGSWQVYHLLALLQIVLRNMRFLRCFLNIFLYVSLYFYPFFFCLIYFQYARFLPAKKQVLNKLSYCKNYYILLF